jgi:hypothetical protein
MATSLTPITGNANVTNGSTTVEVVGMALSALNCADGAQVFLAGLGYFVSGGPTDTTHFELEREYEGDDGTVSCSIGQVTPELAQRITLSKALQALNTSALLIAANQAGLSYDYTGSTAAPISGQAALNSADPTAASAINFNEADLSGQSVADRLGQIAAGDQLTIRAIDGSARVSYIALAAAIDEGTYQQVGVVYLGAAGVLAPGAQVVVERIAKGAKGETGASSANATTRSAMAAMNGANYPIVFLLEAGRQGTFQWNTANLSTQVAADTQQGIYVAPSSDPTGASGAWVRVISTRGIDPRWCGAKGDGSSLDTTTFQAALDLADFTGIGAVYVPGECTFFLTAITLPDRIEIFGNQWHQQNGSTSASTLKFSGTTVKAITCGLDPYIHNVIILNTSGSTDNSTCVFTGNTSSAIEVGHASPILEHVFFVGWYIAVEIASGGTYYYKSRCVEFSGCCYGHRVTGTDAPYNMDIEAPKSSFCQIFMDAATGSEPRNVKVFGGSIEGFKVVAQNFIEISLFGTYIETQSTAACFAAISPINGSVVNLVGITAYLNGISRFVNASGLSCGILSTGNKWKGQPSSGAIIYYLPAATSTVHLAGDTMGMDSGYEANVIYAGPGTAITNALKFDVAFPYMSTAYAQGALSQVKTMAGLGYFQGIQTAAPAAPITDVIYTADGSGWDPLSKSGGPYQVIRRASSYAGLSG